MRVPQLFQNRRTLQVAAERLRQHPGGTLLAILVVPQQGDGTIETHRLGAGDARAFVAAGIALLTHARELLDEQEGDEAFTHADRVAGALETLLGEDCLIAEVAA